MSTEPRVITINRKKIEVRHVRAFTRIMKADPMEVIDMMADLFQDFVEVSDGTPIDHLPWDTLAEISDLFQEEMGKMKPSPKSKQS